MKNTDLPIIKKTHLIYIGHLTSNDSLRSSCFFTLRACSLGEILEEFRWFGEMLEEFVRVKHCSG